MDNLRIRIEKAVAEAEPLETRIKEFPRQFGEDLPMGHYGLLAGNLIGGINGDNEFLEGYLKKGELDNQRVMDSLNRLIKGTDTLNLYFQLLTEFLEYRQSEFHNRTGHFPDIQFDNGAYPIESEKRLRLHQSANAD